jgi:hypothetical protein
MMFLNIISQLIAVFIGMKNLVRKIFPLDFLNSPPAPSLFNRGGTTSLATSYPLSRRERGPRGEFTENEENGPS